MWRSEKSDRPFRSWFRKNHHNYQGSYDIHEKGSECLREIYELWIKSGRKATHFWILDNGKIVHEDTLSNSPDVGIGSIILSKDLIKVTFRDSTIKNILDED